MSLSQKATSGFLWSMLNTAGSRVITLITGIILARILTPEDFGLVAMLYVFFEVSRVLVDSGFSQAIIREKEISEKDKNTVFTISLIVAVFCYLIIWFAAPGIAGYYNQPRLIPLARIMGLSLIFASFSIIQNAVLMNKMNFKVISLVNMSAAIVAGMISLSLAFTKMGVYALAIKYVAVSFFTSVFFFGFMRWRPNLSISKSSFQRLFGFGSRVLFLGVLNTVFRNIYNLIIGKQYAAATLGYYNQANMFKENASKGLIDALSKVTYPMLSKQRDDIVQTKNNYRKILQLISFVIFPVMVVLAFSAEPMVKALVGDQWLASIPMLQILCVGGMVSHLHAVNLNVLKVYGAGNEYLIQGLIRHAMTIVGVLLGFSYGLYGLLYAMVVVEYLQLFINIYFSRKYLGYGYLDQLKDVFSVLWLSAPLAVTMFLMQYLNVANAWLHLMAMLVAATLVYLFTAHLVKSWMWLHIHKLIKQYWLMKSIG